MAMAQAVLGGRGLHLHCRVSSAGPVSHLSCAVRHSTTPFRPSQASGRVSQECGGHPHRITASGKPEKNEKVKRRRETKLLSLVALPILATITVTTKTDVYNDRLFIDTFNDWTMPDKMIKDIYMLISMVFCWGCCVFGSMNDPFYESDEYRDAGGNGTQYWMYDREEIDEQEQREELFRDELAKEIEVKVGELRELEDADKEKEKELV